MALLPTGCQTEICGDPGPTSIYRTGSDGTGMDEMLPAGLESERGGQWRIYTMTIDGSVQPPLPIPAYGNAPDWSPDEPQFVFTSDRDGDDDIWIMNVYGSGRRNLTTDPIVADAWDDNPRRSTDGNRIVFNSWLENVAAVMVLDVESMRVSALHEPTHLNALTASWSNSGQELVFTGSVIERSE